ncbi:hypothetical protein ABZT17_09610 [Streptomyces sp. NPDC005648]|uniref:hypothetical protein n=1 Tax=Streptomyces sp. NPDC005648 TaxID=3157044 RepID=UPI00339FB3AC
MAISLPRPLHALTAAELEAAAKDRRWPKWQTMALLHSLKLPVLNACLIQPGDSAGTVRTAAQILAAATGTETLMIRSDGGVEKKQYYRGGNTFPIKEIGPRATELLADRRAVILAEPTNRFTNRLTILVRMDRPGPGRPGSLTLEALGPGYDVADLTRGHIPPQVTAHLDDVDFARYQPPRWHEWKITGDQCPGGEDARRTRRLERLAFQTLTDGGHLDGESRAEHAESWLRQRGYLHLFGPQPTREALAKRARQLFEDTFFLARSQPNRNWRCLATAFSVFEEPRTVYWDLVDGGRKYAATATAAARHEERAA